MDKDNSNLSLDKKNYLGYPHQEDSNNINYRLFGNLYPGVKTEYTTGDLPGLTPVDPNKYNKGQLIHLPHTKSDINNCDTINYINNKANLQKNGKNPSENVISVDWFETSIIVNICNDDPVKKPLKKDLESIENIKIDSKLNQIKLTENIYLLRDEGKTNNYDCIWSVIFMGEKVGTLLTHPFATFILKTQAQFKLENKLLYTDWKDIYLSILKEANWTHKSLTRLDIAIDGKAVKEALDLVEKHNKGNVIGRKGKSLFHLTKSKDKSIKDFHCGTSASEKVATIYKKSEEIKESEKTYIKDFWVKNNLDDIENTWRFELRLRSKIANKYNLYQLDQVDYLSSIVRTEVKNWFEFFYQGKDQNKHRTYINGKIEWIDWEKIEGKVLSKEQSNKCKNGIHRAKRSIKDLYYFHYIEGKTLEDKLINSLINEYSLQEWFNLRIDFWKIDFEKEKKIKNINL